MTKITLKETFYEMYLSSTYTAASNLYSLYLISLTKLQRKPFISTLCMMKSWFREAKELNYEHTASMLI